MIINISTNMEERAHIKRIAFVSNICHNPVALGMRKIENGNVKNMIVMIRIGLEPNHNLIFCIE